MLDEKISQKMILVQHAGFIMAIPTIPHNCYLNFKPRYLYYGLGYPKDQPESTVTGSQPETYTNRFWSIAEIVMTCVFSFAKFTQHRLESCANHLPRTTSKVAIIQKQITANISNSIFMYYLKKNATLERYQIVLIAIDLQKRLQWKPSAQI